jgi:cytochrome c oxidase assembly protein subunit 15
VAGAVLVWRQRAEPDTPPPATERWLWLTVRGLVAYGGLVIVAGTFATAAGPHAGGAGTGDVVARLDAWGAGTLKTIIHLHGHMATALGILAVVVWGMAWWRRAGWELRVPLTALCVGVAVQGVVGLVQYHNALPATVVWVHASLGAVLWLSLVWCWLGAGRPAPARVDGRPSAQLKPETDGPGPPAPPAGRPRGPRATAGRT